MSDTDITERDMETARGIAHAVVWTCQIAPVAGREGPVEHSPKCVALADAVFASLTAARLREREECRKAVCGWCAELGPPELMYGGLFKTGPKSWFHQHPDLGSNITVACKAHAIKDRANG